MADGGIIVVENEIDSMIAERRFDSDGQRANGAEGEPAETIWRDDGSVYSLGFSENGERNDTEEFPAVTKYSKNGELIEEKHFSNGVRSDTEIGEPHRIEYTEGRITFVEHRLDDKLHNGSEGQPARTWYASDDSIQKEEHYWAGERTTPEVYAFLLDAARDTRRQLKVKEIAAGKAPQMDFFEASFVPKKVICRCK